MAQIFDQSWYRVEGLRPRLRLHAQMHRHQVRGVLWYVLQDHQTGRHFRISTAAHALLSLMDGNRTVRSMMDRLSERLGAERPTQAETVQLLVQLHQSDLLTTPLPPDLAELDTRAGKQHSARLWATIRNPLAIRLPLWDPDRFLTRTAPLVAALCRPWMAVLLALLVLAGAVLAAMHGPELAANVADRVFAADNVLLIALLYPLAKVVHEAGHAYAVKLGGGAVHEVGVMLLVFVPMPYVDASASAGMASPGRRIAVSVAGMAAELVMAAVAAVAWVYLPPGAGRAAALDIIVLCGVTTLLFNANPLLRFDGYYVLMDAIGIPNLDTRAKKHVRHLLRRHVLGMSESTGAVENPGEAKWLVGYGILSQVYRVGMVVVIGLLIATRFWGLGVALAAASVLQMMVLPMLKLLRWLATARELRGRRPRALAGAGGLAALGAVLLFGVPVPYGVVAGGVVWVPNEAIVRAGSDGFVAGLMAGEGDEVRAGAPLVLLQDPIAAAQLAVLQAEVAVQEARFNAVNVIDRVQARLTAEQLNRARAAAERMAERSSDLQLVAGRAGRLALLNERGMLGRFVRKGDVLGYVLDDGAVGVRAVVPQAQLDLVRARAGAVDVRLAEAQAPVRATVLGSVPSSLDRPPAPALSPEGGGPMLLDPTSANRDRPLDRWYEFQLQIPGAGAGRIGAHAAVRFDLGAEPVAFRLWRDLRQLLLRTVDV